MVLHPFLLFYIVVGLYTFGHSLVNAKTVAPLPSGTTIHVWEIQETWQFMFFVLSADFIMAGMIYFGCSLSPLPGRLSKRNANSHDGIIYSVDVDLRIFFSDTVLYVLKISITLHTL